MSIRVESVEKLPRNGDYTIWEMRFEYDGNHWIKNVPLSSRFNDDDKVEIERVVDYQLRELERDYIYAKTGDVELAKACIHSSDDFKKLKPEILGAIHG